MRGPHSPALFARAGIVAIVALVAAATLAGCADEVSLPDPPDVASVAAVLDDDARTSIVAATRAVESSPRDAAAWRELGRRYERNEVPGHAEIAYSAALAIDPEDARTAYRAAITARKANRPARATECIDLTVELDPTYGPAWRRRGLWLLESGDVEGARGSFSRAAALLGDAPDAPLCFARAALLDDDVDEALAQAKLARDRAPNDPYVRLVFGTALRRAGRYDEAEPHLAAGQGATPRFRDPWTAEIQQDTGKDEALAERAVELEAEGRWDDAVATYEDLLARRPDDSRVMARMGLALRRAGREQDAVAHYDRALERFPGHYDLSIGRVGALQATGDLAGARVAIDALIARWPDRAQAYLVRGELRRAQGDVEGARGDFVRATELAPGDLRGRMFEGRVLLQTQRWREAEAVLAAGLDVPGATPPLPYFRFLLQAQARRGARPDELSATLSRARKVHGEAANSLTKSNSQPKGNR